MHRKHTVYSTHLEIHPDCVVAKCEANSATRPFVHVYHRIRPAILTEHMMSNACWGPHLTMGSVIINSLGFTWIRLFSLGFTQIGTHIAAFISILLVS